LAELARRIPYGGKCKERSAHARVAPGAFHLWRMPARASKARHSILGLPGLKEKEGKKFSICAPFYKCIPPVRSSTYLQGESIRCVIKLNQRLYVIFYCWLQSNLFGMINVVIIHGDEVSNEGKLVG